MADQALPVQGSRGSVVLQRCSCCGEWGKPMVGRTMTVCRWCGERWQARPMVGRPRPSVTPPEKRHER